jgi:hypothetical protein
LELFPSGQIVSDHVSPEKLPASASPWLAPLGLLKGAGAAGLLTGLLGVRPLGIAAAIGRVLFFAGALATYIRARVFHNIVVSGTYLALAARPRSGRSPPADGNNYATT